MILILRYSGDKKSKPKTAKKTVVKDISIVKTKVKDEVDVDMDIDTTDDRSPTIDLSGRLDAKVCFSQIKRKNKTSHAGKKTNAIFSRSSYHVIW